MEIESLSSYLAALQAQSLYQTTSTQQQQNTSTTGTSDTDTYESTISSTQSAIPCDTYGDIMELIKANKQANGDAEGAPTDEDFATALAQLTGSSDTTSTESTGTEAVSATDESSESSSSGSGSDSDSDDTTTTEIITLADGSIYLKTTTTAEDGTETVTMTKVSDGGNGGMERPDMPPMPDFPDEGQIIDDTTTDDTTDTTASVAAEL